AGSIFACFADTSTQQPWQRRLQLLITETYRNGGKNSPRFNLDLWSWTARMPLTPKFQTSFHSRRLSVSTSRRLARRKYMVTALYLTCPWAKPTCDQSGSREPWLHLRQSR